MESSSKRVSLKPRVIFFFQAKKKKSNLHFQQQFSVFSVLLWEILCSLPHRLAPSLFLPEPVEKEYIYILGAGVAIGSAALKGCVVGGSQRGKLP